MNILEENSLFPVLHNTDASKKNSKVDIIKSLCDQVCSPVLWETTIKKMFNNNISSFIEIGPGKVLTGLNSKILPKDDNIKCLSIDKIENINEAVGVNND